LDVGYWEIGATNV